LFRDWILTTESVIRSKCNKFNLGTVSFEVVLPPLPLSESYSFEIWTVRAACPLQLTFWLVWVQRKHLRRH
jgi:hypothetical protein